MRLGLRRALRETCQAFSLATLRSTDARAADRARLTVRGVGLRPWCGSRLIGVVTQEPTPIPARSARTGMPWRSQIRTTRWVRAAVRSGRGDEDARKVTGIHRVLVDGHARVGAHGGEHQLGQTLAMFLKYATTSASLTSGIDVSAGYVSNVVGLTDGATVFGTDLMGLTVIGGLVVRAHSAPGDGPSLRILAERPACAHSVGPHTRPGPSPPW